MFTFSLSLIICPLLRGLMTYVGVTHIRMFVGNSKGVGYSNIKECLLEPTPHSLLAHMSSHQQKPDVYISGSIRILWATSIHWGELQSDLEFYFVSMNRNLPFHSRRHGRQRSGYHKCIPLCRVKSCSCMQRKCSQANWGLFLTCQVHCLWQSVCLGVMYS